MAEHKFEYPVALYNKDHADPTRRTVFADSKAAKEQFLRDGYSTQYTPDLSSRLMYKQVGTEIRTKGVPVGEVAKYVEDGWSKEPLVLEEVKPLSTSTHPSTRMDELESALAKVMKQNEDLMAVLTAPKAGQADDEEAEESPRRGPGRPRNS